MSKVRVYKRACKRGHSWTIDYRHNGRRLSRSFGSDEKLARQVAKKIEAELTVGKYFPEEKKTKYKFKDLAHEFIETHSRRKKRSWKRDLTSLGNLLPHFGDKFLDDITPKMVEQYRIKREEDGRRDSTINREHGLLKAIFNKAITWEWVKDNPASKVPLAKEKSRERFLERDEIHRLIEAVDTKWSPYLKPILVMAVTTAMRKGEILNLKWEDVNFSTRFIKVSHTKTDESREVPIGDWLFNELVDWRNKTLDSTSEYVFINKDGKPFRNVRRSFDSALKRAGIEDFRFHDLRHTAASMMYEANLDIKMIKEIGGWKTNPMFDRYCHVTRAKKQRAMLEYESSIQPDLDANWMRENPHSRQSPRARSSAR